MIDTTYRYPTELIDVVHLANGTRAVLRPALPQDCELQRAFVRALSDESRYFRFMTRLRELPEATAELFTSVDYRSHVALIATIFAGADETMIGEVRYIVDESDVATCEFAIAVADDWQGFGLAHALLGRLAEHAASSGIGRMRSDTVSSNKAMIALAKRIGFAVTQKPEDRRLVHLVKDIGPHDRRPSASRPSIVASVVAA